MAFKYPAARRDESKVGGESSAQSVYVSAEAAGPARKARPGRDGRYRAAGLGQWEKQKQNFVGVSMKRKVNPRGVYVGACHRHKLITS